MGRIPLSTEERATLDLRSGGTALSRDQRPIDCLIYDMDVIRIGPDADAIVAYDEMGEFGYVPWFAIVKDGVIVIRASARTIAQVVYVDAEAPISLLGTKPVGGVLDPKTPIGREDGPEMIVEGAADVETTAPPGTTIAGQGTTIGGQVVPPPFSNRCITCDAWATRVSHERLPETIGQSVVVEYRCGMRLSHAGAGSAIRTLASCAPDPEP